jgi:DNA primase
VVVNIFNAFLNHPDCILTPEDRERLKTKRGFSDTYIDGFKFRSCRPENLVILEALREQFGIEQCLQAGLYQTVGSVPQPLGMLLQPRELIFYLNQFGEAFHMRPHKLGLEGAGIHPYFAGTDDANPRRTVLTESEFKAAASWQLGVPAVGIPGIGVFSKEHFDRLVSNLQAENIHEIVICFDNEVKNDPALPNYKVDPTKRWDTPYYAILMAQKLTATKSFGEVKIATLPDAWRINGKIDIDGALAAGKTAEQYQAVIAAALKPNAYLETLCEEAKKIVQKKLRTNYLSSRVKTMHNSYYVLRTDDSGGEAWEPVSDFVISFVTRSAAEGITSREIQIVHSDGYIEPDTYKLTPTVMSTTAKFQEFLYGCGRGDLHWRGKPSDLTTIVELEHAKGRDEVIIEPDHVGKLETEEDVWLFGNGALIGGIWKPADHYGASWNGTKGFRAMHSVNPGKKRTEHSKPDRFMPMPNFDNPDSVDLKDIAKRLFNNYGKADNQGFEAVLAYAWNLATPYSNDIFDRYNYFPIMYLLGAPSSGKTRLGMWLLSMHGIQIPGSNADDGTAVGLERQITYLSSLPAFLDELRDHNMRNLSAKAKESLLRSIYDRQPIIKGLRTHNNETRAVEPRAPVLIGGEHRPSDEALNTRCLLAVFKEISTEAYSAGLFGSEYNWLNSARDTVLPKVLAKILLHGPAASVILDEIEANKEFLRKAKIGDPRTVQNYAVPAATYNLLIDPEDELGFNSWLKKHCASIREIRTLDSIYGNFLEDLPTLEARGIIKRDVHFKFDGTKLSLAFRLIYDAWTPLQPSRGEGLPGANSVRATLIKNFECQHGDERIGPSTKKCLTFDMASEKCPPVLQEWFGTKA